MVGLRKLMDKIFYEHELRILDDILPSFKRHKQLDDEDKQVRIDVNIIILKTTKSKNFKINRIFKKHYTIYDFFSSHYTVKHLFE